MKELKKLKKIHKRVVGKNLDKINKLKSLEDKKEALKYIITSHLKTKHLDLETKIKKLKGKGKDTFFAETKLILLPHKIKFFNVTHDEKDLEKILNLFKNIEEELENV